MCYETDLHKKKAIFIQLLESPILSYVLQVLRHVYRAGSVIYSWVFRVFWVKSLFEGSVLSQMAD